MSETIPKKTPDWKTLSKANPNYPDLWSPIPTDLIGSQEVGKKEMEITSYWRTTVGSEAKPAVPEVNLPLEKKSLEGRPETKVFKSLRLGLGKLLRGDK
ncbi:MAG: hypothetical protein WCK98_08055 [bacterium]